MDCPDNLTYQCPGESQPISAAVHLARLTSFYPLCRECRFRDQTDTLSEKTIQKIEESWRRPPDSYAWFDEGLFGAPAEGLDRETARSVALAFGSDVVRHAQVSSNAASTETPTVVIAHDGRSLVIELVEAVIEGVRHAGCDVVHLGGVTAPCLTRVIEHLSAQAGLYVGNALDSPRIASLRFWSNGGRPLSIGGGLDPIQQALDAPLVRSRRTSGGLRRFAGEAIYLDDLKERYHALRPLRVGVLSHDDSFWRCLRQLSENVACQFTPLRAVSVDALDHEAFHFTIQIEGDGEVCRLFDEQGQPIPDEATLVVLSQFLLSQSPQATVVVESSENSTSLAQVHERVSEYHGRVVSAQPSRRAMDTAMRASGAILGGGPSGRFWFGQRENPSADALRALTYLLNILSQSDRPLSRVVVEAYQSVEKVGVGSNFRRDDAITS